MVDGFRLGTWVNTQRNFYSAARLDPARVHRLEALLGWTWDARTDRWETGFRRVQEYIKKNGHARVPQSFIVDGYRLGNWVNMQRINFVNGVLTVERQKRLEALTGWTWTVRG